MTIITHSGKIKASVSYFLEFERNDQHYWIFLMEEAIESIKLVRMKNIELTNQIRYYMIVCKSFTSD